MTSELLNFKELNEKRVYPNSKKRFMKDVVNSPWMLQRHLASIRTNSLDIVASKRRNWNRNEDIICEELKTEFHAAVQYQQQQQKHQYQYGKHQYQYGKHHYQYGKHHYQYRRQPHQTNIQFNTQNLFFNNFNIISPNPVTEFKTQSTSEFKTQSTSSSSSNREHSSDSSQSTSRYGSTTKQTSTNTSSEYNPNQQSDNSDEEYSIAEFNKIDDKSSSDDHIINQLQHVWVRECIWCVNTTVLKWEENYSLLFLQEESNDFFIRVYNNQKNEIVEQIKNDNINILEFGPFHTKFEDNNFYLVYVELNYSNEHVCSVLKENSSTDTTKIVMILDWYNFVLWNGNTTAVENPNIRYKCRPLIQKELFQKYIRQDCFLNKLKTHVSVSFFQKKIQQRWFKLLKKDKTKNFDNVYFYFGNTEDNLDFKTFIEPFPTKQFQLSSGLVNFLGNYLLKLNNCDDILLLNAHFYDYWLHGNSVNPNIHKELQGKFYDNAVVMMPCYRDKHWTLLVFIKIKSGSYDVCHVDSLGLHSNYWKQFVDQKCQNMLIDFAKKRRCQLDKHSFKF